MGKKHPLRLWLLATVIACMTAVAVLLCGWLAMINSEQDAAARLSLYWSSYASQFAESHGGWEGVDKQLDADGPYYPEQEFHVEIVDAQGQLLAQYGDEDRRIQSHLSSSGQQSKTIIVNGKLAGKVVTGIREQHGPSQTVWLFALTAGLVVSAIVRIWMHLMVRRLNRSLSGIAKQAHFMLSKRQERFPDWAAYSVENDDWLVAASDALAAAQAHIDRLETVRRMMVADVAHELRTPLAILRTTLDNALFSEASLPPSKIAALHAETMRVSKLVHDLQELSLAESGHLPLEKKWFSFSDLTLSVVDTIAIDAEDKGLSVQFKADHDIRVYADENRIRQVVVNLLGNAIRHARSKVVLTLGLSPEGAFLTIADDGFGIEEEDLPHLFERFYRAKTGISLNEPAIGPGLGLGLAIVKQYAQTHGGRVTAKSSWGEGAEFTVVLPVMSEGRSA
jgi:two-component system sensor histidine kinase BaeS